MKLKGESRKEKYRASEQESNLLELLQWAQPNFNEVKDESLLTKNSPSKLGGVPQGRGSVEGFVDNRV